MTLPASSSRQQIGPYIVEGLLAEGGMGVVHRAYQQDTGQRVALKVLRALKRFHLEGFRREVQTLQRISHPGVVRILDDGVWKGLPWLAMEIVDGVPLRAFFQAHVMQAPTVAIMQDDDANHAPVMTGQATPRALLPGFLDIIAKLCDTLAFLHAQGIVHRDLKPDNVMVRPDNTPVLIDFGLVARFGGPVSREILSAVGDAQGTIGYVAPEQIQGDLVDARADLYAIGCILYEIVTGRLPFVGNSHVVMEGHLHQIPDPPSHFEPDVAPSLDQLIMTLLAKDPRERLGYASDVAAALRKGRRVDPQDNNVVLLPQIYRPSFTGRASTRSHLCDLVQLSYQGYGTVVLISGESGTGKTRLAMEAAAFAREQGMRVVLGECQTQTQGEPLRPLRPLLRSMADQALAMGKAETQRIFGRRAKVLGAYEPIILALHGVSALPDPPPLSPAAARNRVILDLAETLAAFVETVPLFLALDDLQWADELTMAFVASLQDHRLAYARIFILGLSRSEEESPALTALHRAGNIQHIALDCMSNDDVTAIARDMLAGQTPPQALLQQLFMHARGNPFFVAEYLRAAVEQRILLRDEGGAFRLVDQGLQQLPTAILGLVGRRLGGVSDQAQRFVEAAAVFGRDVDMTEVGSMMGLDETEALAVSQELIARFVLEEATEGAMLRFSHDKMREAAYDRIPQQRRRALHHMVAEVLTNKATTHADLAQSGAVLAHHWSMAGATDRAIEAADLAAEHALSRGAYDEAARLLVAAMTWDDQQGQRKGPVTRARWSRRLGEASFARAALDDCLRHTSSSLKELGFTMPTTAPRWILRLAREGAASAWGELVQPKGASEQGDRGKLVEAAAAAGQLASTYYFTQDGLPMVATLLFAANRAALSGSSAIAAGAYARLGYAVSLIRIQSLSNLYFRRARSLSEACDDPSQTALSLYLDAFHCLGVADWQRAESLGKRAAEILDGIGDRQDSEIAQTIEAHALYYMGRFDDARLRYEAILHSARRASNAQHQGWGLFLSARSLLAMGQHDAAKQLLCKARDEVASLVDRLSIVVCDGLLAETLWVMGERQQANHWADRLLERLSLPPLPLVPCIHGYTGALEVYLSRWEEGDRTARTKALLVCMRLGAFALMFPMAISAALRAFGRAALAGDNKRLGTRLLKASVHAAAIRSMPYDEALALRDQARANGDDAAMRRARHLFAKLGCAWHVERCKL